MAVGSMDGEDIDLSEYPRRKQGEFVFFVANYFPQHFYVDIVASGFFS